MTLFYSNPHCDSLSALCNFKCSVKNTKYRLNLPSIGLTFYLFTIL